MGTLSIQGQGLIFSESSLCSVYSWLSGNQSNPNIIGQHISEMHSISPFNEIVFVFFSYYLPSCNPTFISFYILRILWPNSSDQWNFHRLIFKISFPIYLECFTLLNCNAQLFIKKFVYWKNYIRVEAMQLWFPTHLIWKLVDKVSL